MSIGKRTVKVKMNEVSIHDISEVLYKSPLPGPGQKLHWAKQTAHKVMDLFWENGSN